MKVIQSAVPVVPTKYVKFLFEDETDMAKPGRRRLPVFVGDSNPLRFVNFIFEKIRAWIPC